MEDAQGFADAQAIVGDGDADGFGLDDSAEHLSTIGHT